MSTTVLNTTSGISSKTIVVAESPATITGLMSFNRGASAPFAVNSGAANVPNLDADKLDGLDSSVFFLVTGGTLTGDLKFSDALYDIGKSGATRPRDLFLSRDLQIGRNVLSGLFAGVCGFRMTLTTALGVTPADVTGAASIFVTPFGQFAGSVGLYDGSAAWTMLNSAEITIALGTLINAQGYDVFLYNSSGTVTAEVAEWANAVVTMTIAAPGVVTWTGHGMATGNSITFSNAGGALPTGVTAGTQYWITVVDANTFKLSTSLITLAAGTFITTSGSQSGVHTGHQPQARQTVLALQNGILVKSGTTTRRYIGSFFTSAATTTEDSILKRWLWNYYNRDKRVLNRLETAASWSWNSSTFHAMNATLTNAVSVFIGVQESELDLLVAASGNEASNQTWAVAAGEDSVVTAATTQLIAVGAGVSGTNFGNSTARLIKKPSIGYHAYVALEASTGTTTFRANAGTIKEQTGITGYIEA